MSTYLSSVILALALMAPNSAQESQNMPKAPVSAEYLHALEAPKAAVLNIDEYAKKAAGDAGINPRQFLRLISCESEWKEDAVGDHNRSFGILQFQPATFARFSKKYDMKSLDISSSYDQIDLAVLMIRDGYEENWLHCARKAGLLK